MLTAAYAQKTITPDLSRPVYLAGFASNKPATAIHDDLWVRALALRLGSATVVLAALDVIGLGRDHCLEIESAVRQQSATRAELLIACTHTHFGPDTIGLWGPSQTESGVDPLYLAQLRQTVIETCVTALQTQPQPVTLRSAAVDVLGIAKNFRDPDITDEEAAILQFVGSDDRALATLVIYPCHPETLDPAITDISSDYVDTLRRVIEAETGGAALFMPGALGGMMSPATPDHTHDGAARMGETLARACLQALMAAPAMPVDHLSYARREVTIPLQNPLYIMAAEAGLINQPISDVVITETGLIKIGDSWLVTIPGELLPKVGLALKADLKAAGARVAGVVCLANDELGYILAEEDFIFPADYFHPGCQYEESMSVGPKTAPLLVAAVRDMLKTP